MRPTKHEYYLEIALAVSRRSTCLRSHYGAVIVLDDRIVSTGYNGSVKGEENCCDHGTCFREGVDSRTGYDICPARHAEQNAIDRRMVASVKGATMYIGGESVADAKEALSIQWNYDPWSRSPKLGRASLPCEKCRQALVQAEIKDIVIWTLDRTPFIIPVELIKTVTDKDWPVTKKY